MAYEKTTGPLGHVRLDHLAALIAATVANTARSRSRPYKSGDFLPKWESAAQATPGARQQTWEDHMAIMKAL